MERVVRIGSAPGPRPRASLPPLDRFFVEGPCQQPFPDRCPETTTDLSPAPDQPHRLPRRLRPLAMLGVLACGVWGAGCGPVPPSGGA